MLFKPLALFAALAALAVAHPQPADKRQNAAVQVIENCSVQGQVALTFDDGPYLYEMDVVKQLNGGKATFFFNGNNYDCIYNHVDTVRTLYAQGHTLASHTWSHPDLTKLDYNGINQELEKLETAFIRILGVKPLYFRPPFGSYNNLVLQVLRDRGYKKLFLWSDDTGDANGASVQSSKNTYNSIKFPAPHMVLSHSTIQTTSTQVLPFAVPKLQCQGYSLRAVDTCLGSNGEWPYQYIGPPGTPDGSWKC
ncbi:Chitin deacetylase [Vanrija pseudolonga]|uniref:Chitin deacetylase n=1 Tax=Vanrija pseudolonga TaxID=143232 RepID=A0AAF0Y168_9TREE|nr:Chitin deacetylase [Vanrija pseudolonga]